MATLTLDLLEAPRGQAAYRLATACPCCGAPLGLRQNRQTEPLLTGCSAHPGCPLTEPHDPRVQALGQAYAGLSRRGRPRVSTCRLRHSARSQPNGPLWTAPCRSSWPSPSLTAGQTPR